MRMHRGSSALILAVAVLAAAPASAQGVAKRAAKRAAKDATADATKDAAKNAAKKAVAPDAIDLNSATPAQLTKLGLDEATQAKVVAGRPFSSMDDPKIKEAIPSDVLAKLGGHVTVKTTAPATPPTADSASTPATPPSTEPTVPPATPKTIG